MRSVTRRIEHPAVGGLEDPRTSWASWLEGGFTRGLAGFSQVVTGLVDFPSKPGLRRKISIRPGVRVGIARSVEARARFTEKGRIAAWTFPDMVARLIAFPTLFGNRGVKNGESGANYRSRSR